MLYFRYSYGLTLVSLLLVLSCNLGTGVSRDSKPNFALPEPPKPIAPIPTERPVVQPEPTLPVPVIPDEPIDPVPPLPTPPTPPPPPPAPDDDVISVPGSVKPWFSLDPIPEDNCQRSGGPCIWPNQFSRSNSDAWITANHERITEMRPKFLVINFANGHGRNGSDILDEKASRPGLDIVDGRDQFIVRIQDKTQQFINMLAMGSQYHGQTINNEDVPAFLKPEIVKVVDLHDNNGKVNSDAFPRGQVITSGDAKGARTVGYAELFSESFAKKLGFVENGRSLTLGELLESGKVHEVIMVANQVDWQTCDPGPPQRCRPNDVNQITSGILEVAAIVQAYDLAADVGEHAVLEKREGVFLRQYASSAEKQHVLKIDNPTEHDVNTIPWSGHSVRIDFMNIDHGAGALLHSLGHEIEYQYNRKSICLPGTSCDDRSPNPYMQPLFRRFAGFDMADRFGTLFSSFYDFSSYFFDPRIYEFTQCVQNSEGNATICSRLQYEDKAPSGALSIRAIDNYSQGCGNVHFRPGASKHYDYAETDLGVMSFCETFQLSEEQLAPVSRVNWKYLTDDKTIDKDNGGDFLVYWMRNMPGLGNRARDLEGRPMKNWWPFLYY